MKNARGTGEGFAFWGLRFRPERIGVYERFVGDYLQRGARWSRATEFAQRRGQAVSRRFGPRLFDRHREPGWSFG